MSNVRKGLMVGAVVAALAGFYFSPFAAASGERLSVEVAESFEINGELFPAGTMSVRLVTQLSPVTTLNEVWVGSQCLGMLMTHQQHGDFIADRDVFIFARSADGHLVLEALALEGQPVHALYDYRVNTDGGEWIAPEDLRADRPALVTLNN